MRVIIMGAGTGGLTLAHGLKRAGIEVRVFEKEPTRRHGRLGFRVGISPAGSYAMQKCLPPEVFDVFVATCARSPRYFNILTERMEEVLSMDGFGDSAEDPVDSEKSVSRMTLRQVLLTGLEDVVEFGKQFERFEENADGTVTAFFADGTSVVGDVLVGADGARSKLRKQRLPQARMEETGILSIGAKIPLNAETRSLISDKVFQGVSLVMASKGMGAIIHVMEFKWDEKGVKARTTVHDADIIRQWPGSQYDDSQDYMLWAIWSARRWYPKDPTKLSPRELLATALKMTEGWSPKFRRMIELTDLEAMTAINIRTSVPLHPWESSQVTLLGDAVHTMTPGRGVGANTALEDAALLCQRLIEVRDGKRYLIEAIHAYEAEMLEYSRVAVLESRKQMDAQDAIHKPLIGPVILATARTVMRVVNHVPMLKRKMHEKEMELRKIKDEGMPKRRHTQMA
jgi:2-polyprenyl-6-methoxyphenol hydroxylase-like FAD-dependent oxidoreductase